MCGKIRPIDDITCPVAARGAPRLLYYNAHVTRTHIILAVRLARGSMGISDIKKKKETKQNKTRGATTQKWYGRLCERKHTGAGVHVTGYTGVQRNRSTRSVLLLLLLLL